MTLKKNSSERIWATAMTVAGGGDKYLSIFSFSRSSSTCSLSETLDAHRPPPKCPATPARPDPFLLLLLLRLGLPPNAASWSSSLSSRPTPVVRYPARPLRPSIPTPLRAYEGLARGYSVLLLQFLTPHLMVIAPPICPSPTS